MAEQLSRRKFLKLLGLGGGSLAMIGSGLAANLLSGTTIGGNTVWHAGNDGKNSGLVADNADTVDGKDASEIGTSTSEIQKDSLIHNEGFAPDFGG